MAKNIFLYYASYYNKYMFTIENSEHNIIEKSKIIEIPVKRNLNADEYQHIGLKKAIDYARNKYKNYFINVLSPIIDNFNEFKFPSDEIKYINNLINNKQISYNISKEKISDVIKIRSTFEMPDGYYKYVVFTLIWNKYNSKLTGSISDINGINLAHQDSFASCYFYDTIENNISSIETVSCSFNKVDDINRYFENVNVKYNQNTKIILRTNITIEDIKKCCTEDSKFLYNLILRGKVILDNNLNQVSQWMFDEAEAEWIRPYIRDYKAPFSDECPPSTSQSQKTTTAAPSTTAPQKQENTDPFADMSQDRYKIYN